MENNTFEGLEELEQINVDFKAPSDLKEYEKLFDAKGSLELHSQRPYLLFINDDFRGLEEWQRFL